MMKKMVFCRHMKIGFADPSYYYVLFTAILIFLYMTFPDYARGVYENCLILPCMLFLGIQQERRKKLEDRKRFMLSWIMVAWFLFLQCKRGIEHTDLDNIGLFLPVYLFAFPLSSLLQDGNPKKALKIFAGGYLAAAAVLSAEGLLLILNCLPFFLSEHIFWDGARLHVFWHPNIVACFWIIGIVFCTTFLESTESRWQKLGLSALLILMLGTLSLTSCRTAIILTGAYLGAMLFFRIIKHGWKWFIPGALAVLVITVAFYIGAKWLYDTNNDILVKKYTQQYAEQIAPENTMDTSSEMDDSFVEIAETEILNEATEVAKTIEAAETTETMEDVPVLEGQEINAAITNSEEEYSAEEHYEEPYPEDVYSEEEHYEEAYYEEDGSADNQEETIPIAINPDTGEVYLITDSAQGTIESDFGTLNSRTYIWSAAKYAIRETPSILYWGMHNPGWYVSFYNFFPVSHLHNAWMQCLMGLGLVGFLIAMIFTIIAVWNCLVILLKHHQDIWKRNIALLTFCLLVTSVLEPYLFYTTIDYNLTDFLFFLCAGYLAHWQERDNRCIIDKIRNRISSSK